MSSPSNAARFDVRIKSLEREKAGAPIVDALKGIGDAVYKVYQQVRGTPAQTSIDELADALGVRAKDFKVSQTVVDLRRACGVEQVAGQVQAP